MPHTTHITVPSASAVLHLSPLSHLLSFPSPSSPLLSLSLLSYPLLSSPLLYSHLFRATPPTKATFFCAVKSLREETADGVGNR
jgi:hypothetical protein